VVTRRHAAHVVEVVRGPENRGKRRIAELDLVSAVRPWVAVHDRKVVHARQRPDAVHPLRVVSELDGQSGLSVQPTRGQRVEEFVDVVMMAHEELRSCPDARSGEDVLRLVIPNLVR